MSDSLRDDMLKVEASILAQRGKSPRVIDAALMSTAQDWAERMARTMNLSHANMAGRAASNGWRGWTLAENVAMGSDTAEGTYKQWMGSPGHRSNILDSSMNVAGFGHAIAVDGSHYWAADYGTRSDAPPTSTNPPRRKGWLARLLGRFGIAWCLLAAIAVGEEGERPPLDARRIVSCEVHDCDTLVKCVIDLGLKIQIVDQSIRVAGVDACETTLARQATLKRQGAVLITPDEIARGKEGTERLKAISTGGKWWVRLNEDGSVYGRLEGVVWLETSDKKWVRVDRWIISNGYERPVE